MVTINMTHLVYPSENVYLHLRMMFLGSITTNDISILMIYLKSIGKYLGNYEFTILISTLI
jgi:hypothetical protein